MRFAVKVLFVSFHICVVNSLIVVVKRSEPHTVYETDIQEVIKHNIGKGLKSTAVNKYLDSILKRVFTLFATVKKPNTNSYAER